MFTKEEKNAAATGGYSTSRKVFDRYATRWHFPEQAVKIYRFSGAKTVVDFDLPTFVLIMATTGLAQYQTCIRTRKMPIQIATHTLWRKKLVVSDSLHSVVFGLTLDRLINLERSSYMTGCPVHQLKK